jgi:hypothetical protein
VLKGTEDAASATGFADQAGVREEPTWLNAGKESVQRPVDAFFNFI